jgi:DNA-binding transcriptional MerR regulator
MNQGFVLDELIERASRVLSHVEQMSARVQERPDVRTIRYYASLGLLDKPLYLQGRTAFYGERHVAQLIAIKRLQAQQMSLQQIQARLLGISDDALFTLAQLPRPAPSTPPAPRRRHWAELPAPIEDQAPRQAAPVSIQGMKLNETVTLLLHLSHSLTDEERQQIQEKAQALLQYIEEIKRGEQ